MSSNRSWKLTHDDGTVEQFIDVRRKVGNRVLRAYLLNPILISNKFEKMKASLRGPKNEFQDFAKFIVLKANEAGESFRYLIEAGVYENLRIVGTDSEKVANSEPDDLEKKFTSVLQNPDDWESSIVISLDSKVKTD